MKQISLRGYRSALAVVASLALLGGCSKTFMCHLNGTQCPAQSGAAAAPSGGGGGGGGGGGEESSGESGESNGNESAPSESSESPEPSSSESSESSSESSGAEPAAAPRDCKPIGAVIGNVHECCSDADKLTPDHTAHVCCDHDSDSSCS